MGKFTKFSDWEKTKYAVAEKEDSDNTEGGSELMAKIADLVTKRKAHIKNKEDFEAQILEIDIKILKLDLEKMDLKAKRQQLTGAKEIASKQRTEGKSYD
jgi:hypothetical protein